jgi:hypothetical protein
MLDVTQPGGGPDRGIRARLYAASRYHAGKARALLDATDALERLDAAGHAGAAVELIAKAVLADFDVRLLPDREAHHALLEAVAELRGRRDTLATKARNGETTVRAGLAIELAARVADGCRSQQAAARSVMKARNAAVHMAVPPDVEHMAGLMESMQAFTDAAASRLRGSSRDYWGIDFDDVQRQHRITAQRLTEAVEAKVAGAAALFARLVDGLSEQRRESIITELRRRTTLTGDVMEAIECPACHEEADVAWDWDGEVEEEFPGECLYTAYLVVTTLRCPVCGLTLDASELAALGLELETPQSDPAEDFDAYQ